MYGHTLYDPARKSHGIDGIRGQLTDLPPWLTGWFFTSLIATRGIPHANVTENYSIWMSKLFERTSVSGSQGCILLALKIQLHFPSLAAFEWTSNHNKSAKTTAILAQLSGRARSCWQWQLHEGECFGARHHCYQLQQRTWAWTWAWCNITFQLDRNGNIGIRGTENHKLCTMGMKTKSQLVLLLLLFLVLLL